jgi:hypothetical protein
LRVPNNGVLIEYDFTVNGNSLLGLRTARIQNEQFISGNVLAPEGRGILNATEFSFFARFQTGYLAAWLFVNPTPTLLDGYVQVQGSQTDRITLIRPTVGRPRWCTSGVPVTTAPVTTPPPTTTTTTTTTTTAATAPTTSAGSFTIVPQTSSPTSTSTATTTTSSAAPFTGLTLPTLLPFDLTTNSAAPPTGIVVDIVPSGSSSGVLGSDSTNADGGSLGAMDGVPTNNVVVDSDLALPIGLGVAGGIFLLCACLLVALVLVRKRRRERATTTTAGNYSLQAAEPSVYGSVTAASYVGGTASPYVGASSNGPGTPALVGIYSNAPRNTASVTQYMGLSQSQYPSSSGETYGNIELKSNYAADSEITS